MIDIGKVPSGTLTLFNAYVALSCRRGWDNIRLLHDFEVRLFTQHLSKHLRLEDLRLAQLNEETAAWWAQKMGI